MYKTALVAEALQDGRALIEALVKRRFPVSAAVWYYLPENMRWRLFIVSRFVDQKGPLQAYRYVQRELARLPASRISLDDISVLSERGTDFQDLRVAIERTGSARVRRGGRMQDVVFEDAYIYRL